MRRLLGLLLREEAVSEVDAIGRDDGGVAGLKTNGTGSGSGNDIIDTLRKGRS